MTKEGEHKAFFFLKLARILISSDCVTQQGKPQATMNRACDSIVNSTGESLRNAVRRLATCFISIALRLVAGVVASCRAVDTTAYQMQCKRVTKILFIFTAFAVCGGNYAGTLNGNLSTPNYPQNYPDSSNCIWIIHCPSNYYVSVSLPKINIEEDKTCAFDYLVFYDGNSPRHRELSPDGSLANLKQNRVCGSLNNMKWTSTSYSITAKFISDDSTSEKGFSGTWHCKQKFGEY